MLAERYPHMDATYLHDHGEERQALTDCEQAATDAVGGDEAARARLVDGLRRLELHAHAHITKENELILPLVARELTVPEQGKVVRDVLSTIPPQDMPRFVPWIIARNPLPAATAYVRVLQHAMPAPVFDKARGWIRAGVSAERWQELSGEIDGLA